jgi:hypothetical protein
MFGRVRGVIPDPAGRGLGRSPSNGPLEDGQAQPCSQSTNPGVSINAGRSSCLYGRLVVGPPDFGAKSSRKNSSLVRFIKAGYEVKRISAIGV